MSDRNDGRVQDTGVWKRLMGKYALAMVAGVAVLSYVMPRLSSDSSEPMMAAEMLGGLLFFGGGFGIVVALFFHYLNKKR